MGIASLDRHVTRTSDETSVQSRISAFRNEDRYVLLGEPGIGKSTVFWKEAAAAGTIPVRALDFVTGERPEGRVVFIDALEEYRIGEAGVDRLHSLIQALKDANYAQWRIACRAISLPPPDARRLEIALGAHATLQLDLLDPTERRDLLVAAGEKDPYAFVERMAALGADQLLGNPATLLLLRDTFERSMVQLDTREALFAEATRQMSHEINPEMPERSDRPVPVQIEAAAEAACLVLLLSVRSDLWLYASAPPHASVVTRDDLVPGRIDTQALRSAVDTPMFKGDAAGFQPTHRVVAEYLAGRALARAVAPPDPAVPALPLERALAFCNGDNDRPAPALSGVFAWFVTALAKSRMSERALNLLKLDPEAVLFHGDAAALPTGQREVLINLVGRSDPWFLAAMRGSSAIGGLAGDDLVASMRRILNDPTETAHRRQMVLEALTNGRRVPALAPEVRRIVVEPSSDYYKRRSALDAYLRIEGDAPATIRRLLDDMAAESYQTAAEVRAELAAHLVRVQAISADRVRDVIVGYAGTGDNVMGYARGLSNALVDQPVPDLFDVPIEIPRERAIARSFEARSLLDRALAAAIRATSHLTARRLLTWLANAGIDDDDRIEPDVQNAVAGWVDRNEDGERLLFQAIHEAILNGSDRLWRVDMDFSRLTGRELSEALRADVIATVERASDEALPEMARLAYFLVQPFEKWPELYWRLFNALQSREPAKRWFTNLAVDEVDDWRIKNARQRRDRAASLEAISANDREWLRARIGRLRDGSLANALGYASDVYHGYARPGDREGDGAERVTTWLGGDAELIDAVREGWGRLLESRLTTPRAEGQSWARKRWSTWELMVIAWAEWRLRDGLPLDFSLPLAFKVLRHAYGNYATAEPLRETALARIYSDPDGASALLSFWAGALQLRADDLPEWQYFDPAQPAVRKAAQSLLGARRKLGSGVLHGLLQLAARSLPAGTLLQFAEKALARDQLPATRRLWAFVAFLLAPDRWAKLLQSDLTGEDGDVLFERLWDDRAGPLLQLANAHVVARCEALITHLGARHGPPTRSRSTVDRLGEVVSNAVAELARQPTEEAALAFARLVEQPALASWKDTLDHHRGEQLTAMRTARFQPPAPRDVALALAAGPPATAADLRAIVRHSLEELARDIRDGDTSPWRNFWNRPARGKPSPRIENDCRDLLTDRLRDRLERYGIPVRRIGTETRSASDRRADLLVLGEGAAALPIEAKRHWNKELWTAIEAQLHPYTRSAGSNGHGIYLIFWFGTAGRALPSLPGGGTLPETPSELQALLRRRLSDDDRDRIDIVVIDVSEPPPTPAQAAKKKKSQQGAPKKPGASRKQARPRQPLK